MIGLTKGGSSCFSKARISASASASEFGSKPSIPDEVRLLDCAPATAVAPLVPASWVVAAEMRFCPATVS